VSDLAWWTLTLVVMLVGLAGTVLPLLKLQLNCNRAFANDAALGELVQLASS
jgi:hypothetical protein